MVRTIKQRMPVSEERTFFMVNVTKVASGPWMYYMDGSMGTELNWDKCGKWMHYTKDADFAAKICRDAVEQGIVRTEKHIVSGDGIPCCFYLERDDMAAHKRVISYLLENNLIARSKTGKLYNLSFKLDPKTSNWMCGSKPRSDIKLDQFVDLTTGKWIRD